MAKPTVDNTNLRLKTVLDVLTEGVWSGDALNAGEVLAEATARVPFSDHEAALLTGGIPRGHKALTSATAKLVKAGWLVKGRSGWTITEDGMRATVAFSSAASFAAALDAGTPVPADVAIPPAPAVLPARLSAAKTAAAGTAAAKRAAAEKAPAKKAAAENAAAQKGAGKKATAQKGAEKGPARRTPARKAADAVGKAAKIIEDAVEPVVKAVRSRKAAPKEAPATAVNGTDPLHEGTLQMCIQPEAVAVAGDFNTILGAPANWAPQYDEAQLALDAVDQLWKITADLPAGYYTFKIALNRSWDENYGAFGIFDGPNHELHHDGGPLTIHYDHRSRDITIT